MAPSQSWLRWLLLFGVWLLYGVFGLVATSLAPLVPLVEADLSITHSQMGSILGAWQLTYIFAAVPCGILLDRLGTHRALLAAALLIAGSAFARSLAVDYWGLLFAVMLFGLGGPLVSSGAPKVVTGLFAGADRGLAMGIYMTGMSLGGVVSLTLTHSVLLPQLGGDWRTLLRLWAGLAVLAGLIWFGLGALRGKSVATGEAGAGQRSGRPLDMLQAARQSADTGRRTKLVELLRLPAVPIVLVMSVGVFVFNHGLNNWLPELLRAGGKTFVESGYWAALPTVVGIFGSLLIPRLATPERRFDILLALCACAAFASLLLHSTNDLSLASGLLLQGIARSSLMTVLILTLVELPGIGERYAGAASGLFFSAAEVGGVLGPLGLGIMYELTGGFSAGLYALTAICAGLFLLTLRLRERTGLISS